ncbi:MAG: B12-binding domain-containing radical SAM protein [Candidatus Riflebacteria bacterium]|nr:B12-binding domain-containing radical SAM protein [Candidatus Riflebacteria bacterium]
MEILLIAPRMGLRPMDSEFKRRMSPSLALPILAALTPPAHRVTIRDENVGDLTFAETPDLVGLSVDVTTAPRAYAIAAAWRQRGIPVILGGTHPSACPDEAGRHADAVCVGEAEEVWPAILADAQGGRLRARYQGPGAADPALIPAPALHLLDRQQYLYVNHLMATRGCPHSCDFCYNSGPHVTRGFRPRPLDRILAEIERLDTRQVLFVDDNLAGDPDWTRQLAQALYPRGLTWHAAVSADIVDRPGLLDAMAASGCRSLFIGLESLNPASLAAVDKRQNRRDTYARLVRLLHERDIMLNASLVLGLDHDGPDVFRTTADWLIAHRVETMTAHILTPYPGTRLFHKMEAEGRILERDWARYDTSHVVFRPRHLSPEELRRGYLGLYEEFYSLTSILRRLPRVGPRRLPFLVFNLAYRKWGSWLAPLASRGRMALAGRLWRRLSYHIE